MAATPTAFEQLILSKTEMILMKLDALAGLGVKVDNLQMIIGANATTTTDALAKVIHNEFVNSTPAPKDKKKVATTEGGAATEEKKTSVAKRTHPSLSEVTEAAWGLKKTGDDYDRRLDWFICVLTKHPDHIHPLIGSEEVKRIESSDVYKGILAQCKKQGDREKAKSFLAAIKQVQTTEGKFAELSKKLVADYDTQLNILNSQKIGQLTVETPGIAEAAAASALAVLSASTTPVTVHTTTADATTANPASQLAAV